MSDIITHDEFKLLTRDTYDPYCEKLRNHDIALRKENERFRKMFWLAAQDELFFCQWDEKLGKHDTEGWHLALCCNDFFYAAADAESVPEDEHLDELLDLLIELVKKFGDYGPLAWIALKRDIKPRNYKIENNPKGAKIFEEAKEWLKSRNVPDTARCKNEE